MPNTTTPRSTDRFRVLRRAVAGSAAALRRLDDWTLIAFNPRYPSPRRGR